ncbi:MAG: CAP domain-containing protein [Blastocatellia bacterium]
MLKLINDYRAQNGLGRLSVSIALTRSGDWMSTDMSTRNYFGHNDSLGRDPFVRMTAFGYNYPTTKGENLAAGYGDAARTFNQWKNSPSHNAAMLDGRFKVLGVSRIYGAASQYKWYWTTDLGGYVDALIDGPAPGTGQTVRTVNAANYFQTVAPEAIATTFGTGMTGGAASATSFPLPASLGGVTVTVNEQPAQLFYASGSQINFVVPASVGPGTATVKVMSNGAMIGSGAVTVENVSPAIFTTSANGLGVAVAQTTSNGTSYQPTANADGTARSISVGTAALPNYLVLYTTGTRRRSSLSAVRVTIGGVDAQVTYLGPNPRFTGLDQLNAKMPLEVRGRGLVDVVVTVDGRVSNVAKLSVGN